MLLNVWWRYWPVPTVEGEVSDSDSTERISHWAPIHRVKYFTMPNSLKKVLQMRPDSSLFKLKRILEVIHGRRGDWKPCTGNLLKKSRNRTLRIKYSMTSSLFGTLATQLQYHICMLRQISTTCCLLLSAGWFRSASSWYARWVIQRVHL